MLIQPPFTITNSGRGFLFHIIFGAGQDQGGLICSEVKALDTEEGLATQSPVTDTVNRRHFRQLWIAGAHGPIVHMFSLCSTFSKYTPS